MAAETTFAATQARRGGRYRPRRTQQVLATNIEEEFAPPTAARPLCCPARRDYLAAHALRAVLEVVLEDVESLGLRAVVLLG